jgi:hypothetical protein
MRSELELWVTVAALVVAGILAISALIISKKPEAKQLIDKLVPYQSFIGVGLLVWGLINLFRYITHFDEMFKVLGPLPGTIIVAAIASEVLLGFLFGMPLIAKWIPGDSPAEQKVVQMQQKIAGWSVLIGVIGLASALGLVLLRFGVFTKAS